MCIVCSHTSLPSITSLGLVSPSFTSNPCQLLLCRYEAIGEREVLNEDTTMILQFDVISSLKHRYHNQLNYWLQTWNQHVCTIT